ncbi:MAG: 1-deoxy-D-xylulose-5-phosphate reductoisomerase [Alphaproteobacteria bacterium]|nr:1-deoxy-D-xylulose-5-phosphate reductoisomerase [Alphaproteobacteria bacterium]
MKKSINILGVTGSVGQSTADVILSAPERFEVMTLSAHRNVDKLADMAVKLDAQRAVIADESRLDALKVRLEGTGIASSGGQEALEEAAAEPCDITVAAIVGMAGLRPIIQAVRHSKAVAIANKEPLVSAGPLVIAEAAKHRTALLPVDSEHNAIFQVFEPENRLQIEKLILTASGGPFRTWDRADMARATPQQALAHPNWSMGAKISVDSATMMNKALEVIEAHYLFDMPPEKIEILVHPQSVVHSMVEYADGSVLAQMGASDMRTPLAQALAWPERMKTPGRTLDLQAMSRLTFEPCDMEKFPATAHAYTALEAGPYACIALNAANEVAVDAFLATRIGFFAIMESVEHILAGLRSETLRTLDDIIRFDHSVREATAAYIDRKAGELKKEIKAVP